MQVEEAYNKLFVHWPADDEFFEHMETAYIQFRSDTERRPITPTEIKMSQRKLRDAMRKAMAGAIERIRNDAKKE